MQIAAQLGGVLLILWLHCSSVSCQAPPSQVDYDYSNGPNGPANWGNFPGWGKCKTGTTQSPINISQDVTVLRMPLDVDYKSDPVPADIYNNGHTPTVEILDTDAGILTISGVKYELEDFHFHSPSEHHIINHSFAMEQHLVHKSADGKVAVIGLLYKLGRENEFLAQFFGNLPPYTTPNGKTPITIKLPLLKHDSYYQYDGSLTTPPCDEGVVWIVLNHFPTLSSGQLQQLQTSKPEDNARPIQSKNGRPMYLYFK